ncbi:hypothetical protein BC939DRAFT_452722 [Gamsiella multidivaricata]|uniref:uncharacterized protein n=1 Tax=Gamsiella multidivaricata TaxID=101098 RepID=UPI00221F0DF9|nr:uncharacterized protein BC939DRAFT_452722 [Gamsiella multidivaricata]KAI7823068.1 hypothetical protein BC939DRAFT_452722 [Gamsiella multidivaricata]
MAATPDALQLLTAMDARITAIENDIKSLTTIEPSLLFLHNHFEFFRNLVNGLDPRLAMIENAVTVGIPAQIHKQTEMDKTEVITQASNLIHVAIRADLDEIRRSVDTFRRDAAANWATKGDVETAKLSASTAVPQASSSKPKVPPPTAFSGKREECATGTTVYSRIMSWS